MTNKKDTVTRNIAFFITSNIINSDSFISAKNHFFSLAHRHNYQIYDLKTNNFQLFIIYAEKVSIEKTTKSISFPIGNLGKNSLHSDRYLNISIKQNNITIANDYAGCVPVYYSNQNFLSLSNIEPCVMLDTDTQIKDFSSENIYGFLRFSHFIWDETAYRHISVMKPDSEYQFHSNLEVSSNPLNSICFQREKDNFSDDEIAKSLSNLNDRLVYSALGQYSQIILPLSSGYDSRMVLAAISKRDDLRQKTHCFTYGSIGSIDVESARRLTKEAGVKWDFIELPNQFLEKEYLNDIYDIFGCSLHMHGMYQWEFWNEICKKISVSKNACLTSGFMTGIPAGQNISMLNIQNNSSLSQTMNKFSQSKYWTQSDLEKKQPFQNKHYEDTAKNRFQAVFNKANGNIAQQSILFDIWTRQRNFISYYPRTLEWKIPVVSPHMNKDYINFFMSLSERHLKDRYAIELMFSKHYKNLSSIASNSNGLKSLNNHVETCILFISRILKLLRINFILPRKYRNNHFEFDLSALKISKRKGIYPLLSENKHVDSFIDTLISKKSLRNLYNMAEKGSVTSYQKLITLQSLAFSLLKMSKKNE